MIYVTQEASINHGLIYATPRFEPLVYHVKTKVATIDLYSIKKLRSQYEILFSENKGRYTCL